MIRRYSRTQSPADYIGLHPPDIPASLSHVAASQDSICEFRSDDRHLVLIGAESCGGTYVLRMVVAKRLRMPFGRFKHGKLIDVEPGEYAYVGSALSTVGATCLARRLVRHATRTGRRKSHPIRRMMLHVFPRAGLANGCILPSNGKHLHWNVDHMLDLSSVELTAAYLIRSPKRIEFRVAELLENDPATIVFETRLGAADNRRGTHLLRVEADDKWWQSLGPRFAHLL